MTNKDFYNEVGVHPTNDPLQPETSSFATRRFYDIFKKHIKAKDKVLDLGCNNGRFSFFCEEEFGAECTGIDFSENAIEYAKKVAKIKSSKCKFVVSNCNNLKFKKEQFDVVIFPNNIIECSYNEFEKICQEIKKVLKKNGKFIVTYPMSKDITKYINQDGICIKKIDIPKKGEFEYTTYFYTPGFINYILSKFFDIKDSEILKYKSRFGKDTQNSVFIACKN